MLFTPDRHERLAGDPFTESSARAAIARIGERAASEFDAADGRWPLDPADDDDAGTRASGLYFGAAGVAWALAELAAGGYVASSPSGREMVEGLEGHMLAEPDDPVAGTGNVWLGLAGVLAVAERWWPDVARRDRIAALGWASLASPALEILYGHPGHMLLAADLHRCTGEERWAELWSAGARRLLDTWAFDEVLGAWLWTESVGASEARYVGSAHGLAGNIHVLLSGGELLPADERALVERRAVESVTALAVTEGGHANWPAIAGTPLERNGRIRVQWCHGAPAVLASLHDVAPDDAAWSELLLAGGRLVWDAGPLRDTPGLCHGTAGNAYALLALWRRTGDERWLERARGFAQHAAAQVEERAARLGHGRHSLYTGDEGVAICLAACLAGDSRMPVIDRLL